MALEPNDLLVIQSQTDSKLYKLRITDLDTYLEGSSGIQFRGSVDLNNAASAQDPVVLLPAANGDLYLVETDADTINTDWIMEGGAGIGTAKQNDRIIWDSDAGYWVLVSGGSTTSGTVTGITATTPLNSDGDPIIPVITIDKASTTADAIDGKTAGYVERLADAADVAHTDGTGDPTAVVTADLLKATNNIVEGLVVSGGAVTTVTTTDANGNGALGINPTSGNVVIEINSASDSEYGVVQIASASDITAGTSGPSAVVDASQLKEQLENLPQTALNSITEGGTDIITGALQIQTNVDNDVTIGVNEEVFCPYNFASLPDITT